MNTRSNVITEVCVKRTLKFLSLSEFLSGIKVFTTKLIAPTITIVTIKVNNSSDKIMISSLQKYYNNCNTWQAEN
jgi:hypothetical protein